MPDFVKFSKRRNYQDFHFDSFFLNESERVWVASSEIKIAFSSNCLFTMIIPYRSLLFLHSHSV